MTKCADKEIVDVAIIGAGPAGLSAALYSARAGLSTAVYGDPYSSQLTKASVVENYPTWTGSPSGLEIIEKMLSHAEEFGAQLDEREIKQINKDGNCYQLFDANGESSCAYAVIFATGTKHKKLGVKGEEEYYAKGVGYCTICDGPLYRDVPIAIAGFGNGAAQAALRMADVASSVTLISTKPKLGADSSFMEKIEKIPAITLYENAKPIEILAGDDGKVNSFVFNHAGNRRKIDVKAVFVEVGVLPSSALAADLGVKLEGQFVKVKELQETNVPGFFAAGDITGDKAPQAIISAGDGARAAIGAIDYIKHLGVSSSKLKTVQWGETKKDIKKAVTEESKKLQTTGKSEIYEYVHADEGFAASYNRYQLNSKLLSKVQEKLAKAKVLTVSAHWCPDCRRNVPRMARIAEHLPEWEFFMKDRDEEGVREKYQIRKIPAFIVYDEKDNEIGRIIENPKYTSLEEDLFEIVNGKY